MKKRYLCVRRDNQEPSDNEVSRLQGRIEQSLEGLGFILQETIKDPFNAPSLFAEYSSRDRLEEATACTPSVDREIYEHKTEGGIVIAEYAHCPQGDGGFLVSRDGAITTKGDSTNIYADATILIAGIKNRNLLRQILKITEPFRRLRSSEDRVYIA
jgi:hypothetical protein